MILMQLVFRNHCLEIQNSDTAIPWLAWRSCVGVWRNEDHTSWLDAVCFCFVVWLLNICIWESQKAVSVTPRQTQWHCMSPFSLTLLVFRISVFSKDSSDVHFSLASPVMCYLRVENKVGGWKKSRAKLFKTGLDVYSSTVKALYFNPLIWFTRLQWSFVRSS